MWIFVIKRTKYDSAELKLFLLEVKISLILIGCLCFCAPRDKTSNSNLHIWRFTGLQANSAIYLTLSGRYCSNVKVFHRSQVRVVSLSPQRDIPGLLVLSKSVQRLVASLIYCRPYNPLILLQGHKATACIWRINVTFPTPKTQRGREGGEEGSAIKSFRPDSHRDYMVLLDTLSCPRGASTVLLHVKSHCPQLRADSFNHVSALHKKHRKFHRTGDSNVKQKRVCVCPRSAAGWI